MKTGIDKDNFEAWICPLVGCMNLDPRDGFIAQDAIHIDALSWAVRGRDTAAAEDGRLAT